MASEILNYIGEYLKAHNSFIDNIHVNAYQLPGGEVVKFDDGKEKQFVGVSDNSGTAGYIRYNPQITHQSSDRRISSSGRSSNSFIKTCRLVIYSWDESLDSESLLTKIITDIKKIPWQSEGRTPVLRVTKSNHNYLEIISEEYKKELSEISSSFISIAVDFELRYWPGECELCDPYDPNNSYVLVIDQDGNIINRKKLGETVSVIVFDGIIDKGPPYLNSIIDG